MALSLPRAANPEDTATCTVMLGAWRDALGHRAAGCQSCRRHPHGTLPSDLWLAAVPRDGPRHEHCPKSSSPVWPEPGSRYLTMGLGDCRFSSIASEPWPVLDTCAERSFKTGGLRKLFSRRRGVYEVSFFLPKYFMGFTLTTFHPKR